MLPFPSLVSRLLLLRLFSKLYFILSVVLTILVFAAPALQSFRDGLHQGRLRSAVSWQLPIGAIRRYPKRHQLHRELALPCQGPSGPYLELQPTRPTELLNFLATTVKKKVVMNIGFTFAIARIPRAFLFPCRSSWSAASRTKSLACSSSIRHWISCASAC